MSGKCNVLLFADRIIREDNGKRGIIGSFNTFNFPQFPIQAPPFFIYANLEDFDGEHEFSLNIVKDGSDLVIFSTGGDLKFVDENQEFELIVAAASIVFPKEGNYMLFLKVGGYQYGSRKLIVNKASG